MIEIREASRNDIDSLYNLIMEIAKFHNQEQFVVTSKEEMLNAGFGNSPKFGALLAEYNGKVVGYLSYTWHYSIWKGCEFMNLDDLFILEEYRSHKIGFRLMQQAKNICVARGIETIKWEVEEDNQKAIEFYNKLGAAINIKGIYKWNLKNDD